MELDEHLLKRLADAGFHVQEREHRGRCVWTWTDPRRPDNPQPIYLDAGQAARYMDEQLRREGLFR